MPLAFSTDCDLLFLGDAVASFSYAGDMRWYDFVSGDLLFGLWYSWRNYFGSISHSSVRTVTNIFCGWIWLGSVLIFLADSAGHSGKSLEYSFSKFK